MARAFTMYNDASVRVQVTSPEYCKVNMIEGVLERVCEWDSSVVTVEGLCACVFVLDNGIFWILRDF